MNKILICLSLILLQGCTVLAVADAAGSAVIYAGKTVINTVDAITPDVVNKKKWLYRGLVENIHVLTREGAYRFDSGLGYQKNWFALSFDAHHLGGIKRLPKLSASSFWPTPSSIEATRLPLNL